jgi:hypothetical protein
VARRYGAPPDTTWRSAGTLKLAIMELSLHPNDGEVKVGLDIDDVGLK